MTTADDRARLDEIERKHLADDRCYGITPNPCRNIIREIMPLARDGLRWRDAAAAEGEVEAVLNTFHPNDWPASSVELVEVMADATKIKASLTAAAAWRAANAPKDDERDAQRAQVEILREACRMGIRAIAAGEQYEHELYAALAATEPKDKQP